eukprot:3659424-Prymnesium_polylepis.2
MVACAATVCRTQTKHLGKAPAWRQVDAVGEKCGGVQPPSRNRGLLIRLNCGRGCGTVAIGDSGLGADPGGSQVAVCPVCAMLCARGKQRLSLCGAGCVSEK